MKFITTAMVLVGVALLSACGGGGSGGDSSQTIPTLNVVLSATSGSASVAEGATATITVGASVSGPVTTPVIADIAYDTKVIASVAATPGATPGTYAVNIVTKSDLGDGDYTSPITFRLCQDAACTHVYPGSTAIYTINLSVKLQDWVTFQRNAAHTGYVHTTLDSAKFAKAWTWSNPDNYKLSGVVSSDGNAYISVSSSRAISFNEATGTINWNRNIAVPLPGEMTYDKAMLYVSGQDIPNTFSGAGIIYSIDTVTGDIKKILRPFVQGGPFRGPTIFNNEMFAAQGYNGGIMYKYSLPAMTKIWETPYSPVAMNAGVTPAVDQNYVYSPTGYGVEIYNKSDGSVYAKIGDAPSLSNSNVDFVALIIAPSGRVIVGNPQAGNQLMAIDVPSKSIVWRSGTNYTLQAVVGNGVVYGARNSPFGVDALSETDGKVLWSWTLPATDTKLIENMVVCDNLLFVSSDKATYAIDLETHQTVWTYAAHGKLSLSSSYMLYIVDSTPVFGGPLPSVTAIKLR